MSLNDIKCFEALANYHLKINGYQTIYKCRNDNGRGVAQIIRKDIEHEKINTKDITYAEIIKAKKINNKSISFFTYLKHPQNKINKEIFVQIDKELKNFLGNLNSNILRFNQNKNPNEKILEDTLLEIDRTILNRNAKPTQYRMNTTTEK